MTNLLPKVESRGLGLFIVRDFCSWDDGLGLCLGGLDGRLMDCKFV